MLFNATSDLWHATTSIVRFLANNWITTRIHEGQILLFAHKSILQSISGERKGVQLKS